MKCPNCGAELTNTRAHTSRWVHNWELPVNGIPVVITLDYSCKECKLNFSEMKTMIVSPVLPDEGE